MGSSSFATPKNHSLTVAARCALPVRGRVCGWQPVILASILTWLGEHWLLVALGLVTVIVLGRLYRRVRRIVRRRRPARLHPKLQKYGAEHARQTEELTEQRRAEAEHIIATSSTPAIAGYEIVEQVEAVYVDGFMRPEDALEGLKAVAAMKGANAVTNVRRERGADRRCSASGDAVIVRRIKGVASMAVEADQTEGDGNAGGASS